MLREFILKRPEKDIEWGFKLQGGCDLSLPVTITKLRTGGLADKQGLKNGMVVVAIEGEKVAGMTNTQAMQAIIRCLNELKLDVQDPEYNTAVNDKDKSIDGHLTQQMGKTESVCGPTKKEPKLNVFTPTPFKSFRNVTSTTTSSINTRIAKEDGNKKIHSSTDGKISAVHEPEPYKVTSTIAPVNPITAQAPNLNVKASALSDALPEPPKMEANDPESKCHACHQDILGSYVFAKSRLFCPEHFVCTVCKQNLKECKVFEQNDKFYCEHDFAEFIAPKCGHCGKTIMGALVEALDKKWHPECIKCVHCDQPINGILHLDDEKRFVCERDWKELHTFECFECKGSIEEIDRYLEILGKKYHPGCFYCSECRQPLERKEFFVKSEKFVCQMHK